MIDPESLEELGFHYYAPEEKEKNYPTPLEMVKEYQKTVGQLADPFLYETLIKEEYQEWFCELMSVWKDGTNTQGSQYDPVHEIKELADLVYVIYGYAYAKGWNLDEAFSRVHMNNMGRMFQPDGSIKRRDDGKIVKNKDFPKVNLEDLV